MSYNINSKYLGIVLVVMSVIMFLTFLSSTDEMMKAADLKCEQTCGPEMENTCPHTSIPLQSYVGFSLSIILTGIGLFLIFINKKYKEELAEKEKKIEEKISKLKEDEREVYKLIKENKGAMFQSEIVEKTGFSKIKISRILDRLENKGLIERKRRGMTNLVLLS